MRSVVICMYSELEREHKLPNSIALLHSVSICSHSGVTTTSGVTTVIRVDKAPRLISPGSKCVVVS